MIVIEGAVPAEPFAHGQGEEGGRAQQPGAQEVASGHVLPIDHDLPAGEAAAERPKAADDPVPDCADGEQDKQIRGEAPIDGKLEEIELQGVAEDGIAPFRGRRSAAASEPRRDVPGGELYGGQHPGDRQKDQRGDSRVPGESGKAGAAGLEGAGVNDPENDVTKRGGVEEGRGVKVELRPPGVQLANLVPPLVIEDRGGNRLGDQEENKQPNSNAAASETAAANGSGSVGSICFDIDHRSGHNELLVNEKNLRRGRADSIQ